MTKRGLLSEKLRAHHRHDPTVPLAIRGRAATFPFPSSTARMRAAAVLGRGSALRPTVPAGPGESRRVQPDAPARRRPVWAVWVLPSAPSCREPLTRPPRVWTARPGRPQALSVAGAREPCWGRTSRLSPLRPSPGSSPSSARMPPGRRFAVRPDVLPSHRSRHRARSQPPRASAPLVSRRERPRLP